MEAKSKKVENARIRNEAPLMFTLLDAADSALLIGIEARERWLAAKARVNGGASYEAEAGVLHALMVDVDSSRGFAGTWIEGRWRAIQSRVAAAG